MLQSRKPEVADVRATSPVAKTQARLEPPAPVPLPAPEKTSPEEEELAGLRKEARMDQSELANLKAQQSQLEDELAKTTEALRQTQQNRTGLSQQLAQAQANPLSLEAKLNPAGDRTALDTEQALAANKQVEELRASIEAKDKEIAQDQELLQHDRDIRNLISARNVYMAEIYDVAKTGDTQKSFGRVFHTKDKSLVFYGYDLDQQRGGKKASTFQAWGRGVY
jgi:hypothetical protein